MDLIIIAVGIVVAFIAGAAGSAVVILINDRKMEVVERVKRRILHGPEPEPELRYVNFDPEEIRKRLMREVMNAKSNVTAMEILAKKQEAETRLKAMAVSPGPYRVGMKHIKDIMGMSDEEVRKWLRDNK